MLLAVSGPTLKDKFHPECLQDAIQMVKGMMTMGRVVRGVTAPRYNMMKTPIITDRKATFLLKRVVLTALQKRKRWWRCSMESNVHVLYISNFCCSFNDLTILHLCTEIAYVLWLSTRWCCYCCLMLVAKWTITRIFWTSHFHTLFRLQSIIEYYIVICTEM